ncbi:MAG: hypothetical protein AAF770_02465 [Bacteroidota bacterium]
MTTHASSYGNISKDATKKKITKLLIQKRSSFFKKLVEKGYLQNIVTTFEVLVKEKIVPNSMRRQPVISLGYPNFLWSFKTN